MAVIRQPIVSVLGHVDHGKTSLLDAIRTSKVASREAGAITQHIGASEVPFDVITGICGNALKALNIDVKIPGLLFIDTPGHEAFVNLRKRGGSIADIAILVVDVAQGFQPQTLEALSILKEYKTPFVVAANKIDLVNGWIPSKHLSFLESFSKQNARVQELFEEKMYQLVGRLHELGFESERFDRVNDFTKQILIIPVSAKTGEGVSELLLYLTGISQKFLEQQLRTEVSGPGKGSILETREERGLGKTIDVILYDGTIKKNDIIVFGTVEGSSSTKVRALLKPKPLDEMRDPREKFSYADEVHAASGVKIFAPGLDSALPGSPLLVSSGNEEELKDKIKSEIESILVKRDASKGVLLKADTLGSVEALTRLIEAQGILVREASIGAVSKKDVSETISIRNEDKFLGVIFAFNVPVNEDARLELEKNKIPIFEEKVVYALLDGYSAWREQEKQKEKETGFDMLALPAKIRILPDHCFRACKPAIFGVEILKGKLKQSSDMVNEQGEFIGTVKAIQSDKESVKEAKAGEKVAVSMDEPVFGRTIKENDFLYSNISRDHARLLQEKFRQYITEDDLKLLEEILKLTGKKIF
ncbi:translation initiation factor IF-2 [Candidatus Micrarchaeota archaeon]|nr:translation initiation factor IF-2 [Candidatus Micrarchaeota archaeon]